MSCQLAISIAVQASGTLDLFRSQESACLDQRGDQQKLPRY